jgi:hypothetical protein
VKNSASASLAATLSRLSDNGDGDARRYALALISMPGMSAGRRGRPADLDRHSYDGNLGFDPVALLSLVLSQSSVREAPGVGAGEGRCNTAEAAEALTALSDGAGNRRGRDHQALRVAQTELRLRRTLSRRRPRPFEVGSPTKGRGPAQFLGLSCVWML